MKKIIALGLAVCMVIGVTACAAAPAPAAPAPAEQPAATAEAAAPEEAKAGTEETDGTGTHSIGMCIQDLSNATWAAQTDEIQRQCDEEGWTFSCVQHSLDPAKAITQIENFINSNCDFIVIQCTFADALEEVIKTAHDKGITVIGDGGDLRPYCDVQYINDNYAAGLLCGEVLGNWINEAYGEDTEVEIATMVKESSVNVTNRVLGQLDGISSVHPSYKVVAEGHATDAASAMTETENILTANPNCAAITNWGDSMALGTLETARAMGYTPDKFAIIGIDGTQEAIAEILAGSSLIASTSLGGPVEQGADMMNIIRAIIDGTNEDLYTSPNFLIDRTNAAEYYEQ